MKICDQTLRNQCDDSAVLIGVYLTETYNMFNRKDYGFRLIVVESFPATCLGTLHLEKLNLT